MPTPVGTKWDQAACVHPCRPQPPCPPRCCLVEQANLKVPTTPSPQMTTTPHRLKPERDELLRIISAAAAPTAQERQRAAQLVEQLAGASLPFNERQLGGGPWVVSRGWWASC